MKDHTQLKEIDRLNIAQSYAKTLHLWKHVFTEKKPALNSLGFDDLFFRKWIYYFSYCEAAFAKDYIGCYQLHYEKKGAKNA